MKSHIKHILTKCKQTHHQLEIHHLLNCKQCTAHGKECLHCLVVNWIADQSEEIIVRVIPIFKKIVLSAVYNSRASKKV